MTNLDDDRETRYDALDLSVRLHSMANHSPNSVPAGTTTVLKTAKAFEDYLNGTAVEAIART